MKLKNIIVLVLSVLVISCKDKPAQKADSDSGFIEISKAQFESEKMAIGEPELQLFAEKVHFSGTIIPSIGGHAKISLPFPGTIENIRCHPAQMVNKGTVLFEISGHWFIDLQKNYAESSAILSKLESDYKIAKELQEENIGNKKEYTAAQSSYYAEKAQYEALKKQLVNLGLDLTKIESGTFDSFFPVTSPISGYVSSIDAVTGQYVDPQQSIAEIIDQTSFQLELAIFEKDLKKIAAGQHIEFYFNGDKTQKYEATLTAIGKTIMPSSKSIKCYATIENPDKITMVCNQFVEGNVSTVVDSLWAIPATAVLESENEAYILSYENEDDSKYYFKKQKIERGRTSNNYIQLDETLRSKKILKSGTYNIVID